MAAAFRLKKYPMYLRLIIPPNLMGQGLACRYLPELHRRMEEFCLIQAIPEEVPVLLSRCPVPCPEQNCSQQKTSNQSAYMGAVINSRSGNTMEQGKADNKK